MDFLKDIVKEIGDDFTKLASDIDETETYVDTGSYIFNALVSGSIFGGCAMKTAKSLSIHSKRHQAKWCKELPYFTKCSATTLLPAYHGKAKK